MKTLIFIAAILGSTLPLLAQQPQLLQERNYKATPNESGILVSAPDRNGNFLYSGATLVNVGPFVNTFLMVKSNTDTLWTRRNPLKLDLAVLSLLALPSGEFISGGNVLNNNIRATTLSRLNSNGLNVWTNNQTAAQNLTTTMLALPGKDLLLGGWYGQKDYALTRTDSLGIVKWSKGYPWGGSDEYLMDMKFTRNGNIIAAGITDHPSGSVHLKLMLFNQNGDSIKGKQLIVNGFNRVETMEHGFSNVIPLSDGGFLITGLVDTVNATYPNGSYMGMVVKVDSSLNLVWKYVHRTPAVDQYAFTKAKELADGSVIVLGFKFRPSQGGNGFQLYRFSSQGVLKNVYPFTSSICTQTWGVTLDALNDSTFMVGGRCGNNPPITYGFYVAKIKIPGLPRVVSGLPEYSEPKSLQVSLGQSYPNPTKGEAIIPYTLPKSSVSAFITINDVVTGKMVKNYKLAADQYQGNLSVNLQDLNNGLYTYTLLVNERPLATRKLAVSK